MNPATTEVGPKGSQTGAEHSRPIVWHLALLALGAAAPFIALTLYLAWGLVLRESDQAHDEARRNAQATAATTMRTIGRARLILEKLAPRPAITALDRNRCDPMPREVVSVNPLFTNVFTVDSLGQVICSVLPAPSDAPMKVNPESYFNAAMERREFTVGKPAKGVVSGKWIVPVAQPILSAEGNVVGLVGISVDITAMAVVINKESLLPDTVVTIIDPAGIVLTRYPDPEQWAGRDVSNSEIVRIALAAKSGTATANGLRGVERLWAFEPVTGTPWTVLAGRRTEVVMAPVYRTMAMIAVLAAASLAFVVALCVTIARPIVRPIAAIAAAARRMSSGESIERLAPAGPMEIAGLSNDLNQMLVRRVAAENQLHESRQRLDGIVISAMDAIVTVDHDQKITLFNPAAERMFGVRGADMIGQDLEVLLPQPLRPGHARHVARFGETGTTSRAMGALGTVFGLHASGEQFPLEAAISLVEVGGAKFYTAILRDITERVQAERAVQRLNADLERRVFERTAELEEVNRELASYDYSISHDLRAPLNRIRGFSDALTDDFASAFSPEANELIGRIRGSAEAMDRLVTDILSLSTIARGDVHRADADLGAIARNILDSFRRAEPGRRVETSIGPQARASADPGLMRIALENLLGNAWKFTSRLDDARIEFGCDAAGDLPRYFVRDNGAGFDSALAGKLFEPFRRLHSQAEFRGTGIGLATVQRIIRRHGGRIWAEGAVGHGATFYFTLAAVQARA